MGKKESHLSYVVTLLTYLFGFVIVLFSIVSLASMMWFDWRKRRKGLLSTFLWGGGEESNNLKTRDEIQSDLWIMIHLARMSRCCHFRLTNNGLLHTNRRSRLPLGNNYCSKLFTVPLAKMFPVGKNYHFCLPETPSGTESLKYSYCYC